MRSFAKPLVLALSAASLAILPACSVAEDDPDADPSVTGETDSGTVASVLSDMPDMANFNSAIASAQLGSIFDGPGSYTVLAPNDEAFQAFGEEGSTLMSEDQRPLLVGVLRNHILPGHLTPEDIEAAIDAQGGEVSMKTLGSGTVTFTRDGGQVTVTNDAGSTARLASASTAANNGVIIPLDTVLTPAEGG